MATYSRIILSGSTSGKAVTLVATATPGTTIHTAVAGAAAWDEIYLWISNNTATAASLTLEFGGTGVANNVPFQLSIPGNCPPIPILTGQVLNGGVVLAGFGSAASALLATGYCNRIQ